MQQTRALYEPQNLDKVSKALGITKQAIGHWKTRGVPAEHCPDIELLLGIKCEALNPGVNWAVLRKQPRKAKASA